MKYDYELESKKLFTESGIKMLLDIQEKATQLLETAGAFRFNAVMTSGDSFTMIAAVEYLVKQGKLKEVPTNGMAQDRIFTHP